MSPRDQSGVIVRRLLADLVADRVEIDRIAADLAAFSGTSHPWREWVEAGLLHHWYTAVEALLVRIRHELEGDEPTGNRWHRDLLTSMAHPIADVRPAVLRPETVALLADLLAFRHFYRHAYAARLDEERLRAHAATLTRASGLLAADLDGFAAALRAGLADLG